MSKQFTYNKSIDTKIVKAVAEVLGTTTISAKKINEGVVNHVYKITTTKGIFIAKVFRYRNWPERGKLDWIEQQMRKNKVPHAKIVYYSQASKYFPYGFMISEYVSGLSGWKAIKQGKHTLFESWKASGKLLSKVHAIKGRRFGSINFGKGNDSNYVEYEVKSLKEKLRKLMRQGIIEKSLAEAVAKTVRRVLEPFNKRFKPVLVHSDASRDNSILSDNGEFILIDWDNASFNIPLWDYFVLTAWMPMMPKWRNLATRAKAKKSFFQGYGKTGFTQTEIDQIERGAHLLFFAGLMQFYSDRKETYYVNRLRKAMMNLVSNRKE